MWNIMLSLVDLRALVVIAAVSPVLALNYNISLNSQTRCAYNGPTGLTISWNTYNQQANPTVMYGTNPLALIQSVSSNVSVTYNTSLTYNNHVQLSNLSPNTIYYYKPTSLMQNDTTSMPFHCKTPIPKGDMTPYTAALIVDMGTFGPEGLGTSAPANVYPGNVLAPGEQNTIQSLSSMINEFEVLLHPGDIAYADTWLKEAKAGYISSPQTYAAGYKAYESILDDFYDQMTPITTQVPYMVGPGNHESNCDNGSNLSLCQPGQTNFTGFRNHFRMPSGPSGGLENFWYSFDAGMVHYVFIDTETDLGHGLAGPDEPAGGNGENSGPFGLMNQQINWLTNDLASVDRTLTPWIVVNGHRPWYASGAVCTNCQAAFEPLFEQYGVDLYLAGHFHVYERNAPAANNTVDPNGLNNPKSTWYIINGAAGHYDGLDNFTLPYSQYHQFGLSSVNATYGWSKLDFHNCTHMTQSFIASNNNSVLDTATLYKSHNNCAGLGLAGSNSTNSSMSAPTGASISTSSLTVSSTVSSTTTSPIAASGSSTTSSRITASSVSTSSSFIASPTPSSNCFADNINNKGRTFSSVSTTSNTMTNVYCASYCNNLSYAYSGTEYSDECYCSNTAPVLTSNQCTMTCTGDASICGGPNALTVAYNSTIAASNAQGASVAAQYHPQGCYSDDYPTRVLSGARTTSAAMSAEVCINYCASFNFTIAGTEYSDECYCGNSIASDGASYGMPVTNGCTYACAGNSQETCGGSNRLNVYSSGTNSSTPTISSPAAPVPFTAANANGQCASDYFPGNNYQRTLSGPSTSSSSMTPSVCKGFCAGYAYYGVEYSTECYCGNSIASDAVVAGNCTDLCAGDMTSTCGGGYAINIFSL